MVLAVHSQAVRIRAGEVDMEGVLSLPQGLIGVVVFFGSDGSRVKPPGDYVTSVLRSTSLGTLWLDLPALQPARCRPPRVDAGMLAERLEAACNWLGQHEQAGGLPLGLFATGGGASAALHLAAMQDCPISSLVLRGARPDMSTRLLLGRIQVPTLLIAAGLDDVGVDLNRNVYAALRCKKRLEIIPGATRSFDEPGSPEVVARMVRSWFQQHTTFCV